MPKVTHPANDDHIDEDGKEYHEKESDDEHSDIVLMEILREFFFSD